jgi:UDPglucose--hexose-1-phosphate uridylyltransferase
MNTTAELRRDLVTGNYVLVNPARSGRPFTVSRDDAELSSSPPPRDDDACPFCWGNEESTAEELARIGPGAPGAPGWQVRVVRNRYPIFGGADHETGRCEVVVFRDHDRRLEAMDADELAQILGVIRDRLAVQSAAGRASVQVFVNVEWAAGASISHPHAQLIALDFVPPALELEFAMIEHHGPDPVQRDFDLAVARDLVVVDDEIAAWCPWGMPNPFGVRIAPKTPAAPFTQLDDHAVGSLARTLGSVLRSVNDVLEEPAYNVVIFCDQERGDLLRRWRVEVVPRINVGGGFEIGTGVTTHSTDTARAADTMRGRVRRNHGRTDPTLTGQPL